MGEIPIQQLFDQAFQHHRTGQTNEAERLYRQVLARQPNHADAMHFLGILSQQNGHSDVALDLVRGAIALNPNYVQAHHNLGNIFLARGQFDEAIAAYGRAIALRPDYAEAFCNLGFALKSRGRLDEAIDSCRRAIALNPNLSQAHSDLGNALTEKGQIDEAIAACRTATVLVPKSAEAHNNLGMAFKANGQCDEAIAAFRRAIALRPNFVEAQTNLLLLLNYRPEYDARAIYEEHRRWSLQHAEPLRKFIPAHRNDRSPDRRLRIGYVSPDFRRHVVGRFIFPLLEHHDHRQFEVFCYFTFARHDDLTARFRSFADQWREIHGLNDEQACQRIVDDGIDILIDLGGHTAHNRLLLFARKPAPIQVSYQGYPASTGLSTIDYRLTDALADPLGSEEGCYSESLLRLPRTNWCFTQMEGDVPVAAPPAIANQYVTFGSFNNLDKVNEVILQIWAKILREVPGSRLLLKSTAFRSPSARQRVREALTAQGVEDDRLILRGREPAHSAHLAMYGEVDIALDTFPYHGTSTTCDALWMGVPVVTLAGQSHVSRVGVSLLSNVGLSELIAHSPEQYVRIAVDLVGDLNRLETLRRELRGRLLASPLMDGPPFARDVEAAYRQMWQTWCAGSASAPSLG